MDGHIVRVGWFTPEIDPHKLLLLSYGSGRWALDGPQRSSTQGPLDNSGMPSGARCRTAAR